MKKGFVLIFLFILLISSVRCAKRGTPTGGDIDTIPPRFIRASPENFTTNFDAEEIRIYFDEYIKLNKAQEQIIISPPMSPLPEITPLGSPQKYIKIKITDTLQENTTYAINFGQSIVDNNEGNPLPFFKYVFSTGDYIDSLSVSGVITDALLKKPESFVSVMLYEMDEDYTDSIIYKKPPRYITNTLDSLRTFELTNLKEGKYRLVAVKDLNNNYMYNPGKEKIGFIDMPVTIPTDTSYNIVMFRENLAFQPARPKQVAARKLLIGYTGTPELDSLKFIPVTPVPEDFEYRITKVPEKDSIHLWFKPELKLDTLQLEMVSGNKRDTLLTRMTSMPKDSLQITLAPSGNLEFNKNVLINSTTPIASVNEELISIINKDSISTDFKTQLKPIENTVQLSFTKNENQSYRITLLPGAITDFYNNSNDTITKSLSTRSFADYGNVNVTLQNPKSLPVIVQLTDDKGIVKAEQFSDTKTDFSFDYLNPGTYLIRVIYDTNGNQKWDTGDYLQKIKPEEIVYFPEPIDVRPNWDINQIFNL